MVTVMIGGSPRVTRLTALAMKQLDELIARGAHLLVGDRDGVERAIQKRLAETGYQRVIVFGTGSECGNNLGAWKTRRVQDATDAGEHGRRDLEMVRSSDSILMVWDGRSANAAMNVIRAAYTGKHGILIHVHDNATLLVGSPAEAAAFISGADRNLVEDLRVLATGEEWAALKSGAAFQHLPLCLQMIAKASAKAASPKRRRDQRTSTAAAENLTKCMFYDVTGLRAAIFASQGDDVGGELFLILFAPRRLALCGVVLSKHPGRLAARTAASPS